SLTAEEQAQTRSRAAKILEAAGQIEDAFALFGEAEDWAEMTRLILTQASILIAHGRGRTLETWLSSVPDTMRHDAPWLRYWMGICRLPLDPAQSRAEFEVAFGLFCAQKDVTGSLMAWSGAVNTFVLQFDDFSGLDKWIDWLETHLRINPRFPSEEIEARVALSMFLALMYGRMDHPDIQTWMERALVLVRRSPDLDQRILAHVHAAVYRVWMGHYRPAAL